MALPVVSLPTYRRLAGAAVVALVVIVVTGAAVRLTGSGLGCSDWPTCEEGRLAPDSVTDAPAMIEFANRAFTGVVSVAVVLATLGALRLRPRRRDLTVLSLGLVVGVAAEAVLGGLVVRYGLSPWYVMAHFLLSMVLVADAVVLYSRAGHEPGRTRPAVDGRTRALAAVLVAVAAVVLVTGTVVTATGPHAGDAAAERFDLVLADVARVHGGSVVAFIVLVLGFLWAAAQSGAPAGVVDAGRTLLVAVIVQGAIGYTQWFSGVPALLVGLHVLGAVVVWVAAVRVVLSLRQAPVLARSPAPRLRTAEAVPVGT